MSKQDETSDSADQARTEGNQCIALGLGVGGLGTAAALTLGATCPLCFVAAPALIGMGIYRRVVTGKDKPSSGQDAPTGAPKDQ